MASDRQTELLKITEAFLETYNQWQDDETQQVITQELVDGAAHLRDFWEDGDIPGGLRELLPLVDDFVAKWDQWVSSGEWQDGTLPRDHTGIWRALGRISEMLGHREERERRLITRPETIERLDKQGVGDVQICRIWEWTDGDGSSGHPQLWKLEEERSQPGRHTEGETPAETRERVRLQSRERKMAELNAKLKTKIAQVTEPSGSETIEDLIGQGCSAKQIARIRRCKVDEVFAICDAKGIERPSMDYEDVRNFRAPQEPEISEPLQRALDADQAHRDVSLGAESKRDAAREAALAKAEAQQAAEAAEDTGPMTADEEVVFLARQGMDFKAIQANVTTEDGKAITLKRIKELVIGEPTAT